MITPKGSTAELAQLLSLVRSHPALPVGMLDGIDDLLSEAQPMANPYDSPEGIEIFLQARTKLDSEKYAGENL